jgi:ankyrin repeat protein
MEKCKNLLGDIGGSLGEIQISEEKLARKFIENRVCLENLGECEQEILKYWGEYILLEEAEMGELDIVKYLLEIGICVDIQDKFGDTALHWASAYGHIEVVKCLVENGANVNLQNNQNDTARDGAIEYGYIEVVKYLEENGAV